MRPGLNLLDVLLLKFGRRGHDYAPIAGLAQFGLRDRQFSQDQDLTREGDRSANVMLLTEGLAARYKLLSSGRRQITTLLVPGDFLDLSSFLVPRRDFGVVAVTNCRTVVIEHDQLRRVCEANPAATHLLWTETSIEAAIQREWLVSMGRRSAKGQMAHLFCELMVRLAAVGRSEAAAFHLPLTQNELADVLGLSPVHVNRVLKELRHDGVIAWTNYWIEILDWPGLAEIAEFNPAYLGLESPVLARRNGPARAQDTATTTPAK
ncbi:MAG: Crp/Fnr family transcriptional regulator [Aliihoeflea sp.]|uniref:Crp/Fnr family transcriptional regulator n=1 Tax=Aliihoeflea sp. TaxID=2608088 RepID=UPI004033AD09